MVQGVVHSFERLGVLVWPPGGGQAENSTQHPTHDRMSKMQTAHDRLKAGEI